VDIHKKTIGERIKEYLIDYARLYGKRMGNVVVCRGCQSLTKIAAQLGCSREHLNREIIKLKKEGFIQTTAKGIRMYGIPYDTWRIRSNGY